MCERDWKVLFCQPNVWIELRSLILPTKCVNWTEKFLILPTKSLNWTENLVETALSDLEVRCFQIACNTNTLPGKPWKPRILSFTFPGLENAWNLLKNSEKPGILTQNLEKKLVLCIFCFSRFTFQDDIFKKILIYVFVISVLSTQTLIQSQIDLRFHCIYLEITWKTHGILCHPRSGNPEIAIWNLLILKLISWISIFSFFPLFLFCF